MINTHLPSRVSLDSKVRIKDKVSIIIPVYNNLEYIDPCIQSCLKQTYRKYEIILVDDGSTDNIKEHIKDNYSKELESTILKYIYQENRGVSSALNTGIKNSEGEYLLFLGSDDILSIVALEVLVEELKFRDTLEPNKIVFIYAKVDYIDSKGYPLKFSRKWANLPRTFNLSEFLNELLSERYVIPQTCLLKTDPVLSVGGFNEHLGYGEDSDLFVRLVYPYWKAAYMPLCLGSRRKHSSAITAIQNFTKQEASWNQIAYIARSSGIEILPRAYLVMGNNASSRGDFTLARHCYFKGIKLSSYRHFITKSRLFIALGKSIVKSLFKK